MVRLNCWCHLNVDEPHVVQEGDIQDAYVFSWAEHNLLYEKCLCKIMHGHCLSFFMQGHVREGAAYESYHMREVKVL